MLSIALIVTLIMPGNVPDITHVEKMTSATECWELAAKFLLTDVPKESGAIGLAAGCRIIDSRQGS